MAIKTIALTGSPDYTTIALWSAYVKALVTLTEDEEGQYTDAEVATYGAQADLDFSGVTLSGFTITLHGTGSGVHDGTFGTGARIEAAGGNSPLYTPVNDLIIEDFSLTNTTTGGFNNFGFSVIGDCTFRRVIAECKSTVINASPFSESGSGVGVTFESCYSLGGQNGFSIFGAEVSNCTSVNAGTYGFTSSSTSSTKTIRNCVVYNQGVESFRSGYFGTGTYSNNAADDATIPTGTGNVTLTGDPFDADGHTPASSGQLDGVGVDLSISLDAANNSFNATPSIGAYESISAGGASGTLDVTEDNDSITAAGTSTSAVNGTVDVTENNDTSTIVSTEIFTGTTNVTDKDDTSTIVSTEIFTGTLIETEEDDTSTIVSIETFIGILTETEEDDTPTITGSAFTGVSGTLIETEEDDSIIANGNTVVNNLGTVNIIEEDDTSTITGIETLSGTINVTEDDDTSTITGIETLSGTINVTEDDDTSTITGIESYLGVLNVTEEDDTSTISGLQATNVTGTTNVTEDDDTPTIVANHSTADRILSHDITYIVRDISATYIDDDRYDITYVSIVK